MKLLRLRNQLPTRTILLTCLLLVSLSFCACGESRHWWIDGLYRSNDVTAFVSPPSENQDWGGWKIAPIIRLNFDNEFFLSREKWDTRRGHLALYSEDKRFTEEQSLALLEQFNESTSEFRSDLIRLINKDYDARAEHYHYENPKDYKAAIKKIGAEARKLDFSFLMLDESFQVHVPTRKIIPVWITSTNGRFKSNEWFLFIDGTTIIAIATLIRAGEYFPIEGTPFGDTQDGHYYNYPYDTGEILGQLYGYSRVDKVCFTALGKPDVDIPDDMLEGLKFWHQYPIAKKIPEWP